MQKDPKAKRLVKQIYHHQIEVINLHCEHYLTLLATNEDQYEKMIIVHYQSEDNHLGFVNRLAETEKEVNRAAMATFNDDEVKVP